MKTLHFSLQIARRTVALAVFAGSSVLYAQQTAPTATPAAPKLNLTLPATESASELTFSSSSTDNAAVIAENRFDFVDAATSNAQPGQRRYGRPRYRGGNTNPDGSNKYAFIAGGGFTQPLGNTYHYNTPSYSFQVGGGRNFNQNFGLLAQFDWDNLGLTGRNLATESYIFTGVPDAHYYGLDASTHLWSFSLNPVYNLAPAREGMGAYVVGGVGFYHKNTQFTFPQQVCGYDVYGYYECYSANSSFPGGTYNSNALGVNGGFGLTYKVSRFSNERLYGEIRYVVTFNSQRTGATLANANTYPGNDFYPGNSNRTTYLPVKFGVRF